MFQNPYDEPFGRVDSLVSSKRNWSEVAVLILRIEESGEWRVLGGSFTEWLGRFADQLDIQPSNLWRYRSSAHYGMKLFDLNLSQPDKELIAALGRTSAENLELLSKLSRVAPDDVFKDLVGQVLAGTLTRTRLRATWGLFKSALGGRTAQGRAKLAPKVDNANPEERSSVERATILTKLANAGPEWLRQPGLVAYRLVQTVRSLRVPPGHTLDAVILVRTSGQDAVNLLGVKVLDNPAEASAQSQNAKYCNSLWLVVTNFTERLDAPDGVGVVSITDDGPVILKEPWRTGREELVGRLALELVGQLM